MRKSHQRQGVLTLGWLNSLGRGFNLYYDLIYVNVDILNMSKNKRMIEHFAFAIAVAH